MRKALAFVISAGLGLGALGGAALADKGPGMFERSDTNGDGFVSKEEFAAGRNDFFAKLDANGDGVIDQGELDKAREAWHQRMNKPAQTDGGAQTQAQSKDQNKEHRGFMQRMDTNGDGKITAEEFAAAGEQMFAKLDKNADGKLAKDEMPHHRKHSDAPAGGDAPAQ
ncbi:MAG TPA: EF-hand domain-containing protein [Dongiaceae bacterium]|jgi:Ca2+-binding EF-hand superfamily protein|nr:EF-hand domain-containing protein [Dongiaceae bacterium]